MAKRKNRLRRIYAVFREVQKAYPEKSVPWQVAFTADTCWNRGLTRDNDYDVVYTAIAEYWPR